LNTKLQELLTQEGIQQPSRAQKLGIPLISGGSHILLIAPTGAGKTEAAVLPIFHNFLERWVKDVDVEMVGPKKKPVQKFKGISILYVTPLRALNRDMLARLKSWGERLGIDVAVRHGDTTQKERKRLGKYPPNMLITTPETLQILLISKNLKEHLKTVRVIVIDEVHELAQDERGAQMAIALERLESSLEHRLQRIPRRR
jgi:ATP-dependent Lhr-like helicase